MRIVASDLGKRFYHRSPLRPMTLQERVVGRFQEKGPGGGFWALRHVSFEVRDGCITALVGANGAGKSTLLRLACRVGRPDEGSILVNGRVNALLDMNAGFHPELTGRENVYVCGVVAGLRRSEISAKFDEIVGFSELSQFIDDPLRTYSSGMQVRLAFAVAMAVEHMSEVLIVDEVLVVGDLAFEKKCLDRILAFRDGGGTVLVVSHNNGLVRSVCDEALWLRDGHLVAAGPAGQILDRYIAEQSQAAPALGLVMGSAAGGGVADEG